MNDFWLRGIGGKLLTGENRNPRKKKPIRMPFLPPGILHELTRDQTRIY
jgi:hypothetical protein